jgi:AAA domain, putative AbiEii toxin, Type IV TA system
MDKLRIRNVGQIVNADIKFGDLTVFVGPQATGKSIALQLLKLVVDTGFVQTELKRFGIDWNKRLDDFLDVFLGEGMRSIWKQGSSEIDWNGSRLDLAQLVSHLRRQKDETLFFIPAQRVLTLRAGWPRPFTDYQAGDPFAVREFSEKLRILLETEFEAGKGLFPQPQRLKKELRLLLSRNLFRGFDLRVERHRSQKRLVLGPTRSATSEQGDSLPFMVWSAGQREFVPLLLGFYWLMPPKKVQRRKSLKWIVIEELEMGLHPRAIDTVLLLVFELIRRGYRVCLSTHSPQVLEALWLLRNVKKHGEGWKFLLRAFNAPKTQGMRELAEAAVRCEVNVHYFSVDGRTTDISDLDPEKEGVGKDGWGGLAEFSSRANMAVADAIANTGK